MLISSIISINASTETYLDPFRLVRLSINLVKLFENEWVTEIIASEYFTGESIELEEKNTVWYVSKYGVFSGPYSVRMRENTDQKKLRIWTLFTQWKNIQVFLKIGQTCSKILLLCIKIAGVLKLCPQI